jgi:hypothetical protein
VKFEEFKEHFPSQISKSLVNYVANTVLKKSRYLFIKTMGSIQNAYCTHCGKVHHPSARLKHKQKERVQCPYCKSMCGVRSGGISRKYMEDRAVLVWYEKSRKSSQAITARVIAVRRDYSGDFRKVQTEYNCLYMYLFEPGHSSYFEYGHERTKITSAFDKHYSGYGTWPRFRSDANIRQVVKGTPFQYSTWEKYLRYDNKDYVSDMVEFFDLASRYPCIEYLTKSGMQKMVWAKLYRYPTFGAINWNGKTLPKVLRLTKQEVREIKESGLEFSPHQLRFYQKAKKTGLPIGVLDAFVLADIEQPFYQDYYNAVIKLAPEKEVIKYILKQVRKGHYSKASTVLTDWNDYWKQCRELGMNDIEKYFFPNDLHEAHSKLTRRIKMKQDKQVNMKIKARLPELQEFSFEWRGLMIRPAKSSIELFDEGKALIHCVGGYAKNYAEGKTNIFLIRTVSDPETPFFTLESRGSQIIQCRGFENCDMTESVQQFVDRFKKQKLIPINKKLNRQIQAGHRQEAAV